MTTAAQAEENTDFRVAWSIYAGWKSVKAEADIPENRLDEERRWALRIGLTGADTIEDKSIPTFARGELPHFAGINTFLKAPYAEDVLEVANYDATVLGIPFDGGTIYRPGTRVIVDVLGSIVAAGTLGKHKRHIDKPVSIPHGQFKGKGWSNAT